MSFKIKYILTLLAGFLLLIALSLDAWFAIYLYQLGRLY